MGRGERRREVLTDDNFTTVKMSVEEARVRGEGTADGHDGELGAGRGLPWVSGHKGRACRQVSTEQNLNGHWWTGEWMHRWMPWTDGPFSALDFLGKRALGGGPDAPCHLH